MKPEEFIKCYEVENVKTLIEKFEKDQFAFKSFDPAADCCFDAGLCMGQEKAWWDICIYDLKRLVESVDYLNEWYEGKIDDAYDHVERMHGMLKLKPQFPNLHDRIKLVEGHIENYVSIFGEEHE